MYTLAGSGPALEVVKGMARWTARWTQSLGDADMARVLEREYGGMNEVLYDLAAVAGEAEWRDVAHRFDHERIFRPLAEGRDELEAFTSTPRSPRSSAARRYELTSVRRYRRIADQPQADEKFSSRGLRTVYRRLQATHFPRGAQNRTDEDSAD